ncbi:mitochondrial processing peptide beta subunit, putative [Bodo saltans]|uniref:Mitochondrial processing peptide beta subunit, putative n=1 Tax=Bodo saltans TaxID=75058 RepID=A0A0S4IUJ1_BODSA|nr:mitochondrial processing peptide beta subunit, putative [Bodo saltans]|eukprot:CUG11470.1 mitochondrial processing peptide beta subunit, putative [Bodo saltans]
MLRLGRLLRSNAGAAAAAVATSGLPRNLSLADPHCAAQIEHIRPVVYSTLPNGFRVACEHVPNLKFVTIGVWIDVGSRFETMENSGVAHFLEHLNFKGTKNFTKKQIEDCFESLGAHFNAYTSRDRTAYYIKVFNKDVDRVLELLSDVLQHGNYTPRDVELERPTILAEMREVEMLVDEVIMDNLHHCGFDATADGLPLTILGPVNNIAKTIKRETVLDFINVHYTAPRMTMVCCGGLSPDIVHKYAEKFFGMLPSHTNRKPCSAKYVGGNHTMWNREMMTTHTAVAYPICGARHEDCVPLQLLHNIVGQYHRERHDQFIHQRMNPTLAASLDAPGADPLEMWKPFYTPYEDISLLGYHFVTVQDKSGADPSTKPDQVPRGGACTEMPNGETTQSRVLDYFFKTIHQLAESGPSSALLEEAKCDYKAAQMIMTDSTTNSAEDLGRQMIHFGRRVPMKEIFAQVDAVTPASFRDTLARYVENVVPTVATIGAPSRMPIGDEMERIRMKAARSASTTA